LCEITPGKKNKKSDKKTDKTDKTDKAAKVDKKEIVVKDKKNKSTLQKI
jgi:hypothetical protein